MTSDEARAALREAVARALCDTEWGDGIWDKPGLLSQMEQDAYNGLATAAIDIVLEEAARVAEECAPVSQDTWSTELAERCDMVAAAIRALKEKV